MTAVAQNIKLDEAIQKAKSMNSTFYIWIIQENVLNLDILQDYALYRIGVVWQKITDICTVSMSLHHTQKGIYVPMDIPKENHGPFENFEELRQTYPKLFEVEGDFHILQI